MEIILRTRAINTNIYTILRRLVDKHMILQDFSICALFTGETGIM